MKSDESSAHFPLRAAALVFVAGVLAVPAQAENLPDMRPALVGSGKYALINLIDAQGLMKRGQGHAALFFFCTVQPDGTTRRVRVYGKTGQSDLLRYEVLHKLREAHFIPAVYNHGRVFAQFEGTVAFSIIDGRPHLRIFANQEMSELQKETDFIDPQIVEIPGHIYDFVNIQYPSRSWASEDQPGAAEISLSTDASGHVKDVRLIREIPPGNKFGEVAMNIMKQRTFLPAFRNGKPVDSTIHFVQYFTPEGWGLH